MNKLCLIDRLSVTSYYYDIWEMPLWFTDTITHQRITSIQWQEKGISQKGDLMDDIGTMFDLEELKSMYGIGIISIQYANLKTKVRKFERFYDIKNVWPDI